MFIGRERELATLNKLFSGDDTFLIVARSERDAKTICSELTRYVGQR